MTPTSGEVGTRVTINISRPYSLDGDYQILWSSSPTFETGITTVLVTGHVAKGTSSITASFTVPEAASGIYWVRFVRLATDESSTFYFPVQPGIKVTPSIVKAGGSVTVDGKGFPGETMVTLALDGKMTGLSARTNRLGSFTSSVSIPDTFSGSHRLLVNTLNGDIITATIEVLPKDNPTAPPINNVENHTTEPSTNNNPQPTIDRSPPPLPVAVSPMGHSFGLFGAKVVTFVWNGVSDPSGVTYTLEIATNNTFSMLSMQQKELTETSCTVEMPPGVYYWRVKAIDGDGNASFWAYAPYAFRVAELSILIDELLDFFAGIIGLG